MQQQYLKSTAPPLATSSTTNSKFQQQPPHSTVAEPVATFIVLLQFQHFIFSYSSCLATWMPVAMSSLSMLAAPPHQQQQSTNNDLLTNLPPTVVAKLVLPSYSSGRVSSSLAQLPAPQHASFPNSSVSHQLFLDQQAINPRHGNLFSPFLPYGCWKYT